MTRFENQLIGQSAAMRDVRRLIEIAAPKKTTVLIQGETGTGKELVASSIHNQSGRKGEFVSINCSAIPADLLESELFGYEKGAFTGAEKTRHGRFEIASGGTLFLDEIGDMPLALQAKLLRAIETKNIQRVGGGKDIPIDLRLVCATHQNIEKDIELGKFRADLFYRINVFPIVLPPLKSRSVDIPDIIRSLMKNIIRSDDFSEAPKFQTSAIDEFVKFPWPGNVRELRNVIERAFLLFPARSVDAKIVKEHLLRLKAPEPSEEQDALWSAAAEFGSESDFEGEQANSNPIPQPEHYSCWFEYFDSIDLRRHLQEIEITLIEASLEKADGMVSVAADNLKLRRTTLIEKMKKYLIEKSV